MIQSTSQKSLSEEKRKGIGERQAIILDVIRTYGPITDKEIAERLCVPDPNYVRPRRFELVEAKLVEELLPKRRCRVSGKTAMQWVASFREPAKQMEFI